MRIPIYNRFISLGSQLPVYISNYKNQNITPILDYCMEFDNNHAKTTNKILEIIEKHPKNYFAVKLTSIGLNDFDINNTKKNLERICLCATNNNSKILIDAENVKYQSSINSITDEFMNYYNKLEPIPLIYKTYQMYRNDSFELLKKDIDTFKNNGVKHGIKMVRGAYYNEDKDSSLLYNNMEETHMNYDMGINYIFNNVEDIQNVIFATHNRESIRIIKLHTNISKYPEYFIKHATLTGMCDNITQKMNQQGYVSMKYLPFGPFLKTMPYFFRRLYENYDILKYVNK
jgi:proline dehydrogenase